MLLLGFQHLNNRLLLQRLCPVSTVLNRPIGTWGHSFSGNLAGISDFNFTFAHNHTSVALLWQTHIAMAVIARAQAIRAKHAQDNPQR